MARPARLAGLALTLLALVSIPNARADEPKKLDVEAHGYYRLSGWNESNLELGRGDVDLDAERLGQTSFLEHRLQAGAHATWGDFTFDLQFDALNGLVDAHDPGMVLSPLPVPDGGGAAPRLADPRRNLNDGLTLASFALRQLSAKWKTKVGLFGLGAMTSNFGMGMLANAGDRPLDDELSDQHFGDRVVRAFYATRPLEAFGIHEELDAVIGADLILDDATGALANGDRGVGGLFALKHVHGNYSSGLFITRRTVTHADGSNLDPFVTVPFDSDISAWAFDLYADYHHGLGDASAKRELFGAAEAAYVTGSTNEVRNVACPGNTASNRCAISQGGGVLRGGLRTEKLTAELTVGYASGDSNPFDGTVSSFHFNRDFQAGLILFDQVLGWQSAAAVRRASNPNLANVAPAGISLFSTDGAITNALFVQPTVKYQPFLHTNFVASLLWARAPVAYTDPYWQTRTSDKTNAFAAPAGQNYGLELDLGANYKRPLGHGIDFLFGVAGGYFLPGDAFAVDASGATMPSVYLLRARTAVTF